MVTKEEIINALRKELPYLRDIFGVKRIGLFGSVARGIQKEESDVDLVVEFEKSIGLKFVELSEHIEKVLGNKAEFLTPTGIKSIRVKKVVEHIKKSIVYL